MNFQGNFQRADLHALMDDLGRATNHLQGSLDGQLVITSANSDDWRSWQGAGELRVRDGSLWDIPIFGFFSPVLNTVVPGLGNSRIHSGKAHFKIDQSVISTDDLELKSPALRLRYDGSVDLKGNVEARMHAEILRDAWGVGRAVSLALWPISKAFEYQITGTVYHPMSQPVYIPKILLWPLHPIRSLERLFGCHSKTPPPAEPSPFTLSPEADDD